MRIRVRKPNTVYRAHQRWHKWFAWFPVRVPTVGRMSGMTLAWWETVERKGTPPGYVNYEEYMDWEYRFVA